MKNVYTIKLNNFQNTMGTLLPFEYQTNCPFDIKRAFVIYNVPEDAKRGGHANRESKHLLIAIKGSCKVKCVEDNEEKIFLLNSSDVGLFINSNIYKEMFDFSNDCILLCLSDKYYNCEEYA